eukprot:10360981-Alexandrium_andersonii.AAC.1
MCATVACDIRRQPPLPCPTDHARVSVHACLHLCSVPCHHVGPVLFMQSEGEGALQVMDMFRQDCRNYALSHALCQPCCLRG